MNERTGMWTQLVRSAVDVSDTHCVKRGRKGWREGNQREGEGPEVLSLTSRAEEDTESLHVHARLAANPQKVQNFCPSKII